MTARRQILCHGNGIRIVSPLISGSFIFRTAYNAASVSTFPFALSAFFPHTAKPPPCLSTRRGLSHQLFTFKHVFFATQRSNNFLYSP